MSISTALYFEVIVKCDGAECYRHLKERRDTMPDEKTIMLVAQDLRNRHDWRTVERHGSSADLCSYCMKDYKSFLERVGEAQLLMGGES